MEHSALGSPQAHSFRPLHALHSTVRGHGARLMFEKKHRLLHGHLADEIHLAVDAETWREVTTKLRAEAPNEACCFLLTRPSRGVARTTVLMREIFWPRPGEVVAEPGSLELSADYISRVMDAAVDAGPMVGLC